MQCRRFRGIGSSCLTIALSAATCGLPYAQTAHGSPPPLTPNEQRLRAAIKADLEKKITDLDKALKASRKTFAREKKKNLSRESRKERSRQLREMGKRLGEFRSELKKVDKGTSTYITELDLRTLEVGQIGSFRPNVQLKVVQVLDDDQVLVEHAYQAGVYGASINTLRTEYMYLVLEGFPARNLVSDKRLDLKERDLFEVHRTTLNSGLTGKTLHVVRAFDRSK